MSRRIIPFLFTAGLLACSSSAATHPAADAVAAQDAADVLTAQDVVAAPDETADVKIWPATVTSSDAVDVFYSQGIARVPDGWIFSASGGLWRTDDKFVQTVENMVPLPDAVTALGYNHIGDIDVAQGVLYASVEQDDFNKGEQAVVLFDPQTLQYKSHVILKQHEASFIAVDETTMTAYLTDHYSDDKILSYDVVPCFRRDDDAFDIPDEELGRWIASDPRVHSELATEKNKACGKKWKPLVKMLKGWNRLVEDETVIGEARS